MDIAFAQITFVAMFVAWILIARRVTVLRSADKSRSTGEPGFLRRLAS